MKIESAAQRVSLFSEQYQSRCTKIDEPPVTATAFSVGTDSRIAIASHMRSARSGNQESSIRRHWDYGRTTWHSGVYRRLGRSLPHLVETVRDLVARRFGLKSLRGSIDTTTSGGKLIFHLFASLAEFERDLIRERTNAGLSAARARGRKGGRPQGVDAKKQKAAFGVEEGRGAQYP